MFVFKNEKIAKAMEIITKGLPTVANVNCDCLGKKFPHFFLLRPPRLWSSAGTIRDLTVKYFN